MKRIRITSKGEELFQKWEARFGDDEERLHSHIANLKDAGWLPSRAANLLLRKGLAEEDAIAELLEEALSKPSIKERYVPPEYELTEKATSLMDRAITDYSSLTQDEADINKVLYIYCNPEVRDSIPPWVSLKLHSLEYFKVSEGEDNEF